VIIGKIYLVQIDVWFKITILDCTQVQYASGTVTCDM